MKSVLLILLLSVSQYCLSENIDLRGKEYSELLSSVFEFYRYEKNQDWKSIYELRSNSFKKIVSYDQFRKACMEEYTLSGRESYQLKGAYRKGDRVFIKAEFVEMLSRQRQDELGVKSKDGKFRFEETLIWVKESGTWLCDRCGHRFKFTLYDTVH